MAQTSALSWRRIAGVDPDVLHAIREVFEEERAPGAAVFALREPGSQTAYLSPLADVPVDAPAVPCGPPPDHPRLRLIAGDRTLWSTVVGHL